jgi:exopolysaccharide biosynthesis protein
VAGAVPWHTVQPGVEVGELALAASSAGLAVTPAGATGWARLRAGALPVRVVLARLDPARLRLGLSVAARPGGRAGPWTVDAAPATAAVAFNAGQFTDVGPWGWVVYQGRERQAPGAGALAGALVVDTAGRARVVDADTVAALSAAARAGDRSVALAVQSYPTLLEGDGQVPAALRPGATAIDLGHRDARLAVGELRDGRLIVALTRFDAFGAGAAERVPVGLTVPEVAALLGALGARRAVLLDGGLSAQLLVRAAAGAPRRWPGLRAVPLGLVAEPR